MLAQIDALAELCDANIRVLVIGAVNDVQLYRQLQTRGVSEYLVPPFQPLQLIQSISALLSEDGRVRYHQPSPGPAEHQQHSDCLPG